MARVGSEAPAGLYSIDRINAVEHPQQLRQIFLGSRWNYVEIESINRSAIENGRQSPDNDKLHAAFVQGP